MKQDMAKDIRFHGLGRARIIENEVAGMSQILARAADRIEKLEDALKKIAYGRGFNSKLIADVAREALKYP